MTHRAQRSAIVSLCALAAAALAACGGSGGSSTGGGTSTGSDQGSVTLDVGAVSSPAAIAGVLPAQGRYFLEIQVTLHDVGTPSPVPAASAYFTLTTASSLVISPSATSSAVDMPCAADISVASGAQLTCNVLFEVPSQDAPALLAYDDQHGHTATAPVSYTPPPPMTACETLLTWKNTTTSACAACQASACKTPFDAFNMVFSDGHTCPAASSCGSTCATSADDCACFETCMGGCWPAADALDQCVVAQCAASCY